MNKLTRQLFGFVLAGIFLEGIIYLLVGGGSVGAVYRETLNFISGRSFSLVPFLHVLIWSMGLFFVLGILLGPADKKKKEKQEEDFGLLETIDYSEKAPELEEPKEHKPPSEVSEEGVDPLAEQKEEMRRGRLFGDTE